MALERRYNILLDILVLLFVCLGVFIAIALISYSKSDPSFSHIVFTNFEQNVQNICGKSGAYISDILYTFLGWAALLIPLLFLFSAYLFLLVRLGKFANSISIFYVINIFIFIIIEFSVISSFLFKDKYYIDKNFSGLFGIFAKERLVNLFGFTGSLVLISTLLLLSFMLLFSFIPFTSPFRLKGFLKFNRDKSTAKADKKTISNKRIEESEVNIEKIDNIVKDEKAGINKVKNKKEYTLPIDLLEDKLLLPDRETEKQLREKGLKLEQKLKDFGVQGAIKGFRPGPVVTLYEFEPASGVKINKITNLEDDLALAMSALSVRIIAPIPGRSVIGIELPNKVMETVYFKELIETKEFVNINATLAVALGKEISGKSFICDLRDMPHLLIAGTTGSGKSVCVNSIILSIIYKSSPDLVKFILIDPKMVELSVYEGVPHLAAPVVTDARQAPSVLKNVVKEMEFRYQLLAEKQFRNIESYNSSVSSKLPYLVVIVDEFADLMLTSSKDVEQAIIRISQMARAVGIHLVLATQRPSVNVITGIIKANMPARLSFRVSSKIDSRTILDQNGAETLLGRGDSLFLPPGTSTPVRIHGSFLSENEVKNVVSYLKTLGVPDYNMSLVNINEHGDSMDEEAIDEKYAEALEFARQRGEISISLIQRYLRIGYNRAARIVELMERKGIVAPSDGTSKPRRLL
jgi:S-DNA-T family DNA segregation ATPase FtsK/SpoIIIE